MTNPLIRDTLKIGTKWGNIQNYHFLGFSTDYDFGFNNRYKAALKFVVGVKFLSFSLAFLMKISFKESHQLKLRNCFCLRKSRLAVQQFNIEFVLYNYIYVVPGSYLEA